MFEKDAKKWVKANTRIEHSASFGEIEVEPSAEKGFQKGAEFGYNKANEWHKDLPTEDVRFAIIEVEDCGYLLCEYRNGIWYDNGSSAVCKDWITRNIKRWKEIVLPKEIKENG